MPPLYRIGQVADLTGLSVHTLRVWERRYGAFVPERTEGGGRLYSDSQVQRARQLASLVSKGFAISAVARLSESELAAELDKDKVVTRKVETGSSDLIHAVRRELLTAIDQFDVPRIKQLVHRAAAGFELPVLIEHFFAPVLTEAGERWAKGLLDIHQEHALTAIVRESLLPLTAQVEVTRPGVVLVTTLQGEHHELGALFAAAWAASLGYRVVFLGTDLPAREIAKAAQSCNARVVLLSSIASVDRVRNEELAELEALLSSTPIVIGGRSAHQLQRSTAVVASLADLPSALQSPKSLPMR